MESIERDVSNRSIKIKFNCISLINIYAYPRGANHPDEKGGDFFRKTLAKYMTREESCLVMGDFNTPVDIEAPLFMPRLAGHVMEISAS